MPKKTFTPEQIVTKLREIEVLTAQGIGAGAACKQAGVSEPRTITLPRRQGYGSVFHRLHYASRRHNYRILESHEKDTLLLACDKNMLSEKAAIWELED